MPTQIAPGLIALDDREALEAEMAAEREEYEATTGPQTILILQDRMAEARKELDKLVRKATRYGNPDVSYSFGEPFQERETRTRFDGRKVEVLGPWRVPVTIEGSAPQVGPYEFLAKIEHTQGGNIVDIIPGRTVDRRFRTTKSSCEHCRTDRQRNETFVLRNTETGEEVQVGRTCLKDFLGYCDPSQVAQRFAFFKAIRDSESEWGGSGWGGFAPTVEVVALSSACIRLRGWASKAQAMAQEITSTRDHVTDVLWPPMDIGKDYNRDRKARMDELAKAVTEADWELAERVVQWAAEGGAGTGDYGHNLQVLCSTELTEMKRAGFVCSAVASYERAMEREVERAKAKKVDANSRWQGQVGERLKGLIVTQELSRSISSDWGDMVLVKFRDEAGNMYTWFTASGTGLQNGQQCKLDGTVKRHSDYNGAQETQLNRCKVVAL